MAIYLDEEMVGEDPNEVAYPHLLLCMGVTCVLDNGVLIGSHVTNGNTERVLLAEMRQRIEAHHPHIPRKLYITGDIARHDSQGGMPVTDKARALGYIGEVKTFDTGTLNPTDGSFVRITSDNHGNCTVVAMLNQEATPYGLGHYVEGVSGDINRYVPGNPDNPWGRPHMVKTSDSANDQALDPGAFHTRRIH